MKKCLWIVPKLIFPVSDGARVANQSLIRSIRPYFEKLDIVIFKEEDEVNIHLEQYQQEFQPDQIHIVPKAGCKNKTKKMFLLLLNFLRNPSLPVTAGYFSSYICKREVRRILENSQYDLLVFDGLHPFGAFLELQKQKKLPTLVYRAHNVEQDLWATAAEKTENPLKRFLLSWQGRKMARLEQLLIENSKTVWAIAGEDQKRFKEISGKNNIHHVPVGLQFNREKTFMPSPLRSQKTKLLFVGKLDWAPNKDGLRWFLHEIWPFVDHRKLELKIVGGGGENWTENFYSFPSLKFLGFIEDLKNVYAEADYTIIPIRFGSGTRIKVIESISRGVPVISTTLGVQGSGLEEGEYIKAQTAQDWIKTLSSLNEENFQEQAQNAFYKFEKTYSPEIIGHNAYLSLQT